MQQSPSEKKKKDAQNWDCPQKILDVLSLYLSIYFPHSLTKHLK